MTRAAILVSRPKLAVALLAACLSASAGAADYVWQLPRGFPRPVVPDNNPMTEEKVALGRLLFYEVRLSVTGNYACASCHQQARAFTDGRAHALGATGETHPRSAMSLANVAYAPALQWADPDVRWLEAQTAGPMLNEHPIEMGLKGHEAEVLRTLALDETYRREFAHAFPGESAPINLDNVARALATFERTLVSGRSAFDRLMFDDERDAMSASARRGMALFFSERTSCAGCHSGINFSGPLRHAGAVQAQAIFANTGLYNTDGKGRYPENAAGLAAASGREVDHGRFRVPTLRNVAVTAPYMHDGSITTLGEVIEHYAAGGRQSPLGPAQRNRYRDARIAPFAISVAERADLVAFLESLTDEEFLTDERLSKPRGSGPAAADVVEHHVAVPGT